MVICRSFLTGITQSIGEKLTDGDVREMINEAGAVDGKVTREAFFKVTSLR